MPMRVPVPMAAAVRGRERMKRRRQVDDLPVADPSFGDDMIGKLLHLFAGSLQHRHLHAAFVVQVHMQRGLREIMMIVEVTREPFRQFALVMVIDVNQGCETLLPPRGLHRMLLQA